MRYSILSLVTLVWSCSFANAAALQSRTATANHSGSVTPNPGLEYFATVNCTVATRLDLGTGPHGDRIVIPITGGTVVGPKLNGKVLPIGADWLWVDDKGTLHPDARYNIQTDDGVDIYVQTQGAGPNGGIVYLHGFFETGSEEYWWLNDITVVGGVLVGDTWVNIDLWYIPASANATATAS
ncbi:hypothetical protein BX600DRAFT_514451 [Xylariales sp. PMI_506]|nr:hypothetical protein BX600DRAFT_514451 [Xylariales sp. PMI_506]